MRVKATSGCPKASRLTISTIFRISVLSERKYLSRAGVLKNKSLTEILVPFGEAASSCSFFSLPTKIARTPPKLSLLVITSTWETAAIEAKASPRNPKVEMLNKSRSVAILLVA